LRLEKNRWVCSECGLFRAPRYRADFYTFPCKPPLKEGETQGSRQRNDILRKKLMEEWRKNKPDQHDLFWDGNAQGAVVCRTCTKKWQYGLGASWRAGVQLRCAGTSAPEEKRRRELKEELDRAAANNEVGEHALSIREEDDTVLCGRCLETAAPRLWKALAARPCEPAPPGMAVEEKRRDKKGGEKRKATTGATGLFGQQRKEKPRSSEEGAEEANKSSGRRAAAKAAAQRRGARAPSRTQRTGRSLPAARR